MKKSNENPKISLGEGNTIARIVKSGLHFEVIVNLEDALKVKKGDSDYLIIEGDKIFTNAQKGDVVSRNDLDIAFKIGRASCRERV